MCERVGYWMWLGDRFKSLGYQLKENALRIPCILSSPMFEFIIGYCGCIISLLLVITGQTLGQRIGYALLFTPPFLLMTHGLYRSKGDC